VEGVGVERGSTRAGFKVIYRRKSKAYPRSYRKVFIVDEEGGMNRQSGEP
jgi:hypothetical protein